MGVCGCVCTCVCEREREVYKECNIAGCKPVTLMEITGSICTAATVSIYDGTHAQVHVRMQVYTLLIDAERKKCTICKLYKNHTTILLMLFDIFSVHEPELLVCTQIYSVGACGNILV